MSKLNSADIEVAVAKYFKPRTHLIVPNISWGMNIHECDLLILNGSNYAVEVEIKISKSDVKADLKKGHGHKSNRIKRLFFAIPEHLNTPDVIELIPERAGIFVVSERYPVYQSGYGADSTKVSYYMQPRCTVIRNAKINKEARPFTDGERIEMGRLGMLRYWNIRNVYKQG